MKRRAAPFVPLKELISKNHDDRVRDYLEQMKGLSIDDIINNTATISAKKHRSTEQSSPAGGASGHASPKMIRGGAEIAGSSNMTSRQTTAHKIAEVTKQHVMAKAAGVAGTTKV